MTTPTVTEIPLVLSPVEPDPFASEPSPAAGVRRLGEREVRERRLELVRRMMRARSAASAGARSNRRTELGRSGAGRGA